MQMNKDLERFLDLIVDILVEQDLKNPPEAPVDSNPLTDGKDSTSPQSTGSAPNCRTSNLPS